MPKDTIANINLEASGSEIAQNINFLPFIHDEKVVLAIFVLIALFLLVLKAMTLWQAAKKNHTFWFILIFIFNTFGLLELTYLFVLSKLDWHKILEQFGIKVKKKSVIRPINTIEEPPNKTKTVKKSVSLKTKSNKSSKVKSAKSAKKKTSTVKKK